MDHKEQYSLIKRYRVQEWNICFTFLLSIERIVLLDFIHRLVSQEQTKLRN